MKIAIEALGGRWDGWHFEHYMDAMPEPGTVYEFPATGRFNSQYVFLGDVWQFCGYRQVIPADTNCKGK